MVLVHVLLISFYFNYSASFPFEYVVNCILGGPTAAPVFMFCMGIGIVYSRRSQPEIMIKRGISLMILGLLVNIFEFICLILFQDFFYMIHPCLEFMVD